MSLSAKHRSLGRVSNTLPKAVVRAAACAVCCALNIGGDPAIAQVRLPLPNTASAAVLPEAIYWKQDLFLVPYQWDSAAEAGAAQAVWLFVSKDQGLSWQKISEAKPQVTAFNYRAEGDGDYWFAIRTVDRLGRAFPEGPYQPELRVIVDTAMPQLNELAARTLENGNIELTWRATDQNFDPASFKLEAQIDASGTWHPAPTASLTIAASNAAAPTALGVHTGHAIWQPMPGARPIAIRATVADLAGNPATYQTPIEAAPSNFSATQPFTGNPLNVALPATLTANAQFAAPPQSGWMSSSTAIAPPATSSASQTWPVDEINRAPFRLSNTMTSSPDDGVTAYGNPSTFAAPSMEAVADSTENEHRVAAKYATGGITGGFNGEPPHANAAPAASSEPKFSPLEPFRQTSVARLPTPDVHALTSSQTPLHVPAAAPKLVGSRTFALEYDLENTAHWGVTKVELWGTRDGGRTWNYYARDNDQISPLVATVDDEGLYGFRIVVESAGSAAPSPPSAGDEPELWVAIDLQRPVIELTSIERGSGNLADHLILRWKAADDNLDSRPIALFYSSRPAGPWSAVATNLEDTGEYSWRVERHVPARFYIRAEARDTAGNLAAFQTRQPVDFSLLQPSGRLK